MDPFSVTVGAVGLLDFANKVTNGLIDRYQAFSSAPRQMLEIADQITLCAGLVDVFAKSVDGTGKQDFPRKFKADAAGLITQCYSILKEIEKMIPHGSQKPGYTERLKYAFSDEKKIKQQQEKLKQVQHMLMFMTTCWMYQLPNQPKEPQVSSSAGQIPFGSFSGFMQQLPLEINIKDPNASSAQSMGYEATLTLKPIEPPTGCQGKEQELKQSRERMDGRKLRGSSRSRETNKALSMYEKQALENMRRSSYFSAKLLKPPFTVQRTSFNLDPPNRDRSERDRKEEHSEQKRTEFAMRGSEDEMPNSLMTKEQAAKGVENILSEWFDDDSELSDMETYHTPSQSPDESRPGRKGSSPNTRHIIMVEPAPSTSPTPRKLDPSPSGGLSSSDTRPSPKIGRRRSWDWQCDGCQKTLFYSDLRYKCRDCDNFDFCPHCYDDIWHRHPKSSFRAKQELVDKF
ncbi:hypothetical protein GLAREA_06050 [Glarea lozoyensis ATCC 20868]|uniref:Uncharacterized protein n=1 Tax=Glarea lozoyensis (strain ATCC 20868 / MF5171) TaxID=1116229 RepID=S3E3M1_GLAL2|nr:uncharacterized protein GLAREA_06050 [Glarea lozoyensis ATCC 20868]EPE33038.1 hypothetical protein GLAREA_06050 [Glarea lozoyensis ATCC 20868]